MTIQPIETAAELINLRDEWNILLRQCKSDCVFLTHQWLAAWWKHLSDNRKLHVIAVRDGNELVGLAPLALQEADYGRMLPRRFEFLGAGIIGSDYLDLIVQPGRETEVFRHFSDHLAARGLMIQLGQLRRGYSAAEEFAAYLTARQWSASSLGINICPFINLEGHTWESYFSTLGPSQRYNFSRRLKNLTRIGMRFECVTTADRALSGLRIVTLLHRKRWETMGAPSEAFQTPAINAFHREFVERAAEQGWLRILTMWLGETPLAALYGLRYGRTFYFYQSGFDPAYSRHSVGLVMMGLAIKQAVDEGVMEYDFLHGDEEYKFHWSRQRRELGRLELFPPQASALIYRRAIDVNRAVRRMARRVLPGK